MSFTPDDYESYLLARGLSPHTARAYVRDAAFVGRLAGKDPMRIGAGDLDRVLARRTSAARLQRISHAWNAFARFAHERLHRRVPEAEYAGRVHWRPKPSLTPIERDAVFRAAAAAGEDGRAVMLLLGAGLRSEEARRLRVADARGASLAVLGKGGKAREVPLGRRAPTGGVTSAAGLVQQLARDARPHDFLLRKSDEDGEWPWSATRLYGACRRIGTAAERLVEAHTGHIDLSGLNPHRLRRGWATDLRRRGVDLAVISALLGHGSLDVTRRYLGVGEYDVEQVRKAIDQEGPHG